MMETIRRLCADRRGTVTIMTAVTAVAIMGFTAIVIDVGNLVYAKRALQAATDAAALAGAQDINKGTGGTAVSTARRYSATTGNLNAAHNLNATMASGYPALRCFTSTGIPCFAPDNANGVVVKQNATVPALFAKALGFQNFHISASAAAGSAGGTARVIDAVIVLDTTQSMNSNDPNCTQSGSTRLTCAFTGFRTLLSGFDPLLDHVAVMIFPGLKASGSGGSQKTAAQNAALEYDCSSSTPTSSATAAYDELPLYLIVPLSSDYKNSNGTMNTNSNLVKAARGGASGCTAGVTAYGGVGTFYADAVAAARDYLTANARFGAEKWIIFLGDGDAGASSSNMPSAKKNNQCRQAITAAQAAKAAGMTVMTIAYGASTSASSSCSTDSPSISACDTLRQMASDSGKFYSTNTGSGSACTSAANSISSLNAIFQNIGMIFGTGSRLLSENTP